MNTKAKGTKHEHSRFQSKPTDTFQQTVRLLRELEKKEHNADRAFAEAVADTRLSEFVQLSGLRKVSSHVCVDRLRGKRCQPRTCPWPTGLPGADHCSEWRKDGRTVLIISQPYQLSYETLVETATFCEQYGLEADIRAAPAWHFPGATLHIEYRKKASPADTRRTEAPTANNVLTKAST